MVSQATMTTAAELAELAELLAEEIGDARRRESTTYSRATGERADRIVLFGAGGLGRRTLAGLREVGVEPFAFADNRAELWGETVDGLRVMSPGGAAEEHGTTAAFVVTIWGANKPHRLEHTVAQLVDLGCEVVVPVSWLQWRHADHLLPHYAQDLPSRLLAQAADVRRAFTLLSDELSRREFVDQVRWRLTGDPGGLGHPVAGPQYLVDDVARPIPNEVIVDCGAYDGDTLMSWLHHRGPTFGRYIALEPDPNSREQLEALVNGLPDEVRSRVVVRPEAVASVPGTATFAATGTASSSVGVAGDGITVELARIDDILGDLGGPAPTFLKMDIEGAELDALSGAARTITDDGPMLALCVYHRQDHLWRVPLAVAAMRPDHQLFLRPHNEEGWDLVLYAVPPWRALG